MKETQSDLEELQAALDHSIEQAGAFLRSSFEIPQKSLSAAQLVHHLQGMLMVSLATVTAKGAPRVAPIGALFYRGRVYIPTVAAAARTRHLQQRPAVSMTYYVGNDLAIIIHGEANVLNTKHAYFNTLESLHRETIGSSVNDWGEGVFLRIQPDVIYTYARKLENYEEVQL